MCDNSYSTNWIIQNIKVFAHVLDSVFKAVECQLNSGQHNMHAHRVCRYTICKKKFNVLVLTTRNTGLPWLKCARCDELLKVEITEYSGSCLGERCLNMKQQRRRRRRSKNNLSYLISCEVQEDLHNFLLYSFVFPLRIKSCHAR